MHCVMQLYQMYTRSAQNIEHTVSEQKFTGRKDTGPFSPQANARTLS